MSNGEWDVFGPDLGCHMPIDWFDTDSIIALLDDTSGATVKIDQLVVGWDGKEERVWEVIRKMCRARGYFWGNAADGTLTFARLRMPNEFDAANPTTVTPIPRVLKFEPAEGEGIDRIVGNMGALPWFDGVPVELNALGDPAALNAPDSVRTAVFAEESTVDMDLSVLSPAEDAEQTGLRLVGLLTLRGFGSPKLSFRAADPGTIDIGDTVKVGDPGLSESWFVDGNQQKILVDSSARWYGQVIAFKRDLLKGYIDLTVVLHAWHDNRFTRLRAPNAVLASTISTLTYTVDANNFLDPSGADATGFTVDDYVELWRPDGVRRSGTAGVPDVQQITAVTGTTVVLDADFSTTGVVGDILRLAHLSTSDGQPEAGNPSKNASIQAYTYMAEDDGTLNPNDDDAHIYGAAGA